MLPLDALLPRPYFLTLALRSPEWPWNVRVGENSPSLCPTMFSVTKTGMNFLPLWTANVKPTMSGVMVERLDQVLMTFLSFSSTALRTFLSRLGSTYGPFLIDRATDDSPLRLFPAFYDVGIGSLVLPGLVPLGRFPPRRAGMPPPGGFSLPAAERVVHRIHGDAPNRRPPAEPAAPAGLPERHLLVVQVSHLPHRSHAIDQDEPYLSRTEAQVGVPAFLRENLDYASRRPGHLPSLADLELHVVDHRPHRDLSYRKCVARFDVRVVPGKNRVSHGEPDRTQDVPFLPVRVMKKGDAGRPVRIVFDRGDPGRDVLLVSPEVDHPVFSLVPPPPMPDGDSALVVPPCPVSLVLHEALLRLLFGELLVRKDRHGPDAGGGRLGFLDSHGCGSLPRLSRHTPSKNSILSPGLSTTTAFFQPGRLPTTRPLLFFFPETFIVLTSTTLTLNSFSTASWIWFLFARGSTANDTALVVSLSNVAFSVINGRFRTSVMFIPPAPR